jgi:hypothetical protein
MESWIGVAMSVIALAGTTYSARNARLANKDKAETERGAAKDKLDFELKVKEMELQSAGTNRRVTELESKVADCEKRHDECNKAQQKSEEEQGKLIAAQTSLQMEVAQLKSQLASKE